MFLTLSRLNERLISASLTFAEGANVVRLLWRQTHAQSIDSQDAEAVNCEWQQLCDHIGRDAIVGVHLR